MMGYEKFRVFVCLVVKVDGIKFKFMVIFKGVKWEFVVLNEEFKCRVVVVILVNGWMDIELICIWINLFEEFFFLIEGC